jgi:uncharacterized protein YndB with AHSA1/START domain
MSTTLIENLGIISGWGQSRRVELTRLYPCSIEQVWQTIIDPALVRLWFADFTIDPREGGRIQLDFGKIQVTGTIKTMMPPHVFSYTWEQQGESDSLVQFDLIATSENETRLTIVQTSLDAEFAADVGLGWHSMMDRLSGTLITGEFVPEDKSRWESLHQAYTEQERMNG